ncbi:MAG: sigma-70 family RNA polymerase sigma factor [Paracoccaceae bacterium]
MAELLRQVAQGDRAAFRLLYADTSNALFGVLMRMLRNRANAEDGLQEVYARIWQRAASFAENRGSGMTWMMTIARNYAIDQRRQRHLLAVDDVEVDELVDPGFSQDDRLMAQGTADRIWFCLGQLEARQADCIKQAYLNGLSYADLAARYVVPVNTMRTWLRRGLMKLRTCVQD